MPKTITLRVSDRVYDAFRGYAEADNRPISNLIETAALRHLEECSLATREEMAEILGNRRLVARLKAAAREAKRKRGRYVD